MKEVRFINIVNRLSKIEKSTAKANIVEVEMMNGECEEMDLLQAIRLFLEGKIFHITRILKPDEEREYSNRVIQEIERLNAKYDKCNESRS